MDARNEPTPEQIAEACRSIREEGYTDSRGLWHPPWSPAEYERRARGMVDDGLTIPEVAVPEMDYGLMWIVPKTGRKRAPQHYRAWGIHV